jgi:hypothetical protein
MVRSLSRRKHGRILVLAAPGFPGRVSPNVKIVSQSVKQKILVDR